MLKIAAVVAAVVMLGGAYSFAADHMADWGGIRTVIAHHNGGNGHGGGCRWGGDVDARHGGGCRYN